MHYSLQAPGQYSREPSGAISIRDNGGDNIPEGPFTPSVYRNPNSMDTPTDDMMLIGACRSPMDGRQDITPGVLNIDGKQKLLIAPDLQALWTTTPKEDTRLLTLWVNSAATTMTKGDFYDYQYMTVTDLPTLIDWKITTTVAPITTKLYFPLAWITVKKRSIRDRSTTPAGKKDVYRVTRIQWPCQNWILQGGGSGGGMVKAVITGFVSGNKYSATIYDKGMFTDAGAAKTSTLTGKDLYINQIAAGTTLDVGTCLDAMKADNHYEANFPRWL